METDSLQFRRANAERQNKELLALSSQLQTQQEQLAAVSSQLQEQLSELQERREQLQKIREDTEQLAARQLEVAVGHLLGSCSLIWLYNRNT